MISFPYVVCHIFCLRFSCFYFAYAFLLLLILICHLLSSNLLSTGLFCNTPYFCNHYHANELINMLFSLCFCWLLAVLTYYSSPSNFLFSLNCTLCTQVSFHIECMQPLFPSVMVWLCYASGSSGCFLRSCINCSWSLYLVCCYFLIIVRHFCRKTRFSFPFVVSLFWEHYLMLRRETKGSLVTLFGFL